MHYYVIINTEIKKGAMTMSKIVDITELEGKTLEEGSKVLLGAGYIEDGNGTSESNISDFASDTYFTLFDDDDSEVDKISYSEYLNNMPGSTPDDEPEYEVVKSGWEKVE